MVTIELIHYKVYGADKKNKVSGGLELVPFAQLKPKANPLTSYAMSYLKK